MRARESIDYDTLIRAALKRIETELKAGHSVRGLAEWLVQLARDQDALQGEVIPFRRRS